MIITDKTNKVHFEGNFETIEVGIDQKNIAHFFRMIANLYQDPTMAVLREVGANCVDAIIEAGSQKLGWELHLPSRMDANVRFVDNGVGISHDQMIRIYSIIGASSKRGNNDLIGGFGVGKWSLCSLVNNFQAISRFNGTKSQYFISLQSNGLPDIRLIKSESTSERNGFEVKFLCPDRYVNEFNNKVEKAYRFFSIKPKVFCDGAEKKINFNSDAIMFDGGANDFSIYQGHGSPIVVMGGVGYRLPVETILENKKFEKFRSLLNCNMSIHVPIGEYSITPSREAIQLDDLTLTRLFNKFEQIVASFIPKMQADMDNFQGNTWDAKIKLKELREAFSFLPNTLKLEWKGNPLTATALVVKDAKVTLYTTSSWNKKISVDDSIKNIEANKRAFLFVDDLKVGGIGRAKQFILEKKKNDHNGYAFYIFKADQKSKFIQETGWIGDFVFTSSLAKVPTKGKTTTSNGSTAKGSFRMRSGRSYGVHDCVSLYDNTDKHIKDAQEFILFPTSSNKVYGEATATYVDPIINLLGSEYKKKFAALFLAKSEYDSFNDSSFDGKPLVKFCNLVKTNDFKKIINKGSNAISWSVFKNKFRDMANWSYRGMPDTMMELAKVLDKSHIISAACENLKSIIQDDAKCFDQKTLSILRLAGSSVLSNGEELIKKSIEEFIVEVKEVAAKYPLVLPVADEYNAKQHTSPLAEYIGFIDSRDQNKK
jgi:hypothetical protein